MKELTQDDKQVLFDFIGHLNYYEIMAILSRKYKDKSEQELDEVRITIMRVLTKLMT